jgi:cobalamin biosynthesis protein CobT
VLDFHSAVDIVDSYGPYSSAWPDALKGDLEALAVSDSAFADHLIEMRDIEDQLGAWTDDDDGVEIPDEGIGGAGSSDTNVGQDTPINIDTDQLMDMDEMLSAFIERSIAETDQPYRVFTKDLDELTDIGTHGVSLEFLQNDTASVVGPLQKELTRLIAARTQSVRLPGQRKGKLNSSSLHRVVSGDDRVFYRKQEALALDTAVSLVIDCSGSMGNNYNGGSHRSSRIALATKSAYAIASVLHRIGVPFEVLGYTTLHFQPDAAYMAEVDHADALAPISRFTPLSYPRFKEFGEPFTIDIQRRFAAVYNTAGAIAMGSTIEGCAVDFAARRLIEQRAKRKLMIVLSDGLPQGPRKSHRAMSYPAHAAETVKAVAAAGVDIVGVGIQHAGVTNYYPNSMVIQNLQEMPAKLMATLKRFLVS